jgi:hypothetical protein
MKLTFHSIALGAIACLLSSNAHAQETEQLGDPPLLQAGEDVEQVLQPQPPNIASVAIDPRNRSQVALAYQNIYLPQGGVASGWNGSLANCVAGSTSAAYRQAAIDRVNVYRALAGLPGTVALFGGNQASGTEAAALIFSANRSLSHEPPNNWTCWTQAGASAAGNSNIALGSGSNQAAGTGAIDLYMDDGGTGNTAVGHRRWVLYPPQAKMDSGSIPYATQQYAANALWVLTAFGSRPATPNGVAWPPRGYVPWQLLPDGSNRWSFSWNGANFANTSVSMTRNGVPLGVPSYETIQNGYGDNTLVWKPQGVTYAKPAADVTYHVTISGISSGGAPSSIGYDVIVIDPYALSETVFSSGFD